MEQQPALPFLAGGGTAGALMRALDWASTPLGPPAGWPPALRTLTGVMLGSAQPMFVTWGPAHTLLHNDGYAAMLGRKHPDALGRPIFAVWSEIRDDIAPLFDRVSRGESVHMDDITFVMERNGYPEETHFAFSYTPVRDEDGTVAGLFCACAETTAQVFAERRRVAETGRLRAMFDQAPGSVALLRGPDHVFELANPAYERLVGRADLVGRLVRAVLPDLEGQPFFGLLDDAFRSGEAFVSAGVPITLRRAPGAPPEERRLDFVYQPVRDAEGAVSGIFVQATDVTERLQAAEALAEANARLEQRVAAALAARAETEAALRQSQKMEAVGQLTGGLAHDFNNLLTGIIGGLELMGRRIEQGRASEVGRYLETAQGAARRAAALTHRLLAFSRRQTLDPRPTGVERLVAGMIEMVRRTVGPGIAVETATADGPWTVLVDPHQLENALLNLCINARDAMPEGGRLTIGVAGRRLGDAEARALDLSPGAHVVLDVADDGTGMTSEVAARAFDPFFTTKPLGQGTGLGLSMIHGFVRQSGGQAHIESVPGLGTTVRLFLPRHDGPAEGAWAAADEDPAPGAPAGATVLVVDDEPTVRLLVREVLEGLGHAVLEARDGPEALRLLRSSARIDLMVTDVGLPGGLNGRQVADAGRALRPGLGVLVITGYAEAALLGQGRLEAGLAVLTKPFTTETLARRVRAALADAGPPASGA